ncbi:MAG: hypothetical protein AAF629_17000 [Chloroflexota bacterium]
MDQIIPKFMVMWLSFDILVIATAWYFSTTLRILLPRWWKAHICDIDPFQS